jgi:hypothetical protein
MRSSTFNRTYVTTLMDSTDDDLTVTANTITKDLTLQIHNELDQLTSVVVSGFAFDSKAPDILLLVIALCASAYAQTEWPIINFPDIAACAQFLESNQDIRDLLEKAHRKGCYSEIRRRGECPYPHLPFVY